MGIFEIISAILLILACIFIIVVVLLQETKQGMSQAIMGGSADNYFQKNSGRSKEAMLSKATRNAAIVFFVVALAVNIINVYFGKPAEIDATSGTTSSVVSQVETSGTESTTAGTAADTSAPADTSAADTTAADTAPAETAPAETTAAAE